MKIKYMTWLRNQVGCAEEEIRLPGNVTTIAGLLDWLQTRNDRFGTALAERSLIYVSRNGALCEHGEAIADDSEISLFSPIVGG